MQTVRGNSPGARNNSLTKEVKDGVRCSSQHNQRQTSLPKDAARETFNNFQRLFAADTLSVDSDESPLMPKKQPSILENILNQEKKEK